MKNHSDINPAHYAAGTWAWALHRTTGILIAFYSLAHISVISTILLGSGTFDAVMRFLSHPVALWLELGLLAAIILHGLNGIRLILLDFNIGRRKQKEIFFFNLVLSAFIFVVVFFKVLPYLTGGV